MTTIEEQTKFLAAWAEGLTRQQDERKRTARAREHQRERESQMDQMQENKIKDLLGTFRHEDGSLMSLAEVIEAVCQEEAAAIQAEEQNHDNKRKDGKSQRDR